MLELRIMKILGIDIGGSGIKGAIVDCETGELISERIRIETPQPAKPESVAKVVGDLVKQLEWTGLVGCTFPSVIIDGKCLTTGNMSTKWLGVQVDELFSKHCNGAKFYVANDADLAGLAEMNLGCGQGLKGTVLVITIGTGLGSGLFYDGQLIPNLELGRIFHTNGEPIEFYAADSARQREELKLKKWAKRFDFFLNHLVRICSPNHFIIGGGLSKKFEKFEKWLTIEIPISVATYKNNAGIIGAAVFARNESARKITQSD